MNTKQQAVINWIVEKGEGYKAVGFEIDDMVLALEVSPATISRAVAELKAARAYDDDDGFCGRWVKPEQLAAYVKANDEEHIGLMMSAQRKAEAARFFQTTVSKLQSAIEWAESSGAVEVEYGYYGDYLKVA